MLITETVSRKNLSSTATPAEREKYWKDYICDLKNNLNNFEKSIGLSNLDRELMSTLSFRRSYYDLMELAVSLKQYEKQLNTYEETTKVLKIRIDLPRPLIEKYFNLKTISLYGIGLYAPVEGLLLSEGFRIKANYDEGIASNRKGAIVFDTSSIPQELKDNYEFRIAIPAAGGLFVPKKCPMTTGWIGSTRQIEYLDLSLQ